MKKLLQWILLASILTGNPVSAQEKHNVLFIAVDDLNDWVGCLGGHPQTLTPNIDKLASQGVLFTNAHCQAPICGPSRASIMTGLYPSTTGNYLQMNDPDIKKANKAAAGSIFLPDFFERYGYKTMGVGKIYHNGDAAETFQTYGGVFEKFGPKPGKRMKYDPKWLGKPGNTQTDWGPFPERDEQMPDYKSAAWAVDKLQEEHSEPFFLAVGFVRPHVP
jgi:arylsulfatase A-like enzyme